jgi:hypothetical protein
MIINFKTCKINKNKYKFIDTLTLIKKIQLSNKQNTIQGLEQTMRCHKKIKENRKKKKKKNVIEIQRIPVEYPLGKLRGAKLMYKYDPQSNN